MKISLRWLNDFVDVHEFLAEPGKLAEQLTAAGLEVEGVEDLAKPFHKVVLGKIVELGRHPNADRLTVCKVDAGDGKLLQIVCGAKNHRAGDHVVVALPGAVLPGNFEIKESKIRDVESKGMLCSESELGLKAQAEGILILPAGSPIGEPFAKFQGLEDVVIDINVSPNRADCLSHLGLAREVGCLLGREVRLPRPTVKAGAEFTKKVVKLKLNETQQCLRYAGRAIRGVKIGPSPKWLSQRLRAVGLSPINNVVDVTNYVMFELGQPLHAFDLRSIKGGEVRVDRARAGESFVSFDGTERKLRGDELTIRDVERAVALAGIVGGKNSGVENDTTDLFIEAAHFTADSVRRTMRRLGIQTDSAYRFSRGTDPEGVRRALDRACELIQQVAGGEIAADFYDEYPRPHRAAKFRVSAEYVGSRLGYEVTANDLEQVIRRLGCEVARVGSVFDVAPPPYRHDLVDKTDLVEEYGRLKGYSQIPETFPVMVSQPLKHEVAFDLENLLADLLLAEGYQQAVNYGFTGDGWQKKVIGDGAALAAGGLDVPGEAVRILNPITEDLNVMRQSLLPWLFKNALHNLRYGNEIGRLFEIGRVFGKVGDSYGERSRLGMVAWGQKSGLWDGKVDRPLVIDLKASVESLLDRLNVASWQWQAAKVVPSLFHPGQCAVLVCEGRPVGWVASLHPQWALEEKVRVGLALAEFEFTKLMRGQPRMAKAQAIARFPAVERDIALVMPEALGVSDVIRELKKFGGPLLRSVEVFDVFRGGSLPAGQKSVAFRLRLQKNDDTLTDSEIQGTLSQVTQGLQAKLKIDVR